MPVRFARRRKGRKDPLRDSECGAWKARSEEEGGHGTCSLWASAAIRLHWKRAGKPLRCSERGMRCFSGREAGVCQITTGRGPSRGRELGVDIRGTVVQTGGDGVTEWQWRGIAVDQVSDLLRIRYSG